MDKRCIYCAVLFAICVSLAQGYKECQTQEVYGSRYNSDVDGLYDKDFDIRCQGRTVWKRRDLSPGNVQYYIYYYKNSVIRRGWLVGTQPCSSQRQYGVATVWNTNRRPDRGLLAWLEYDQTDLRWRINGGFEVRCTEGLTYPQIVGIVCGCIFGVILIVVGIGLAVRFCKR